MTNNKTTDETKQKQLYLLDSPSFVSAAMVIDTKNEETASDSNEIHACL